VKILTVVGNRPQFIKAAAVSGPLRSHHEEILLHTGQHHDQNLSQVFFDQLGLASPDRELGIAGGTNSSQTARMLSALEGVLAETSPDAVLVYGDTNSTLAGALAGAQGGYPVIHVEAGLRSFDMEMPEELNRVLVDRLAGLLLCPSAGAQANLEAERVPGTMATVGDVMVDLAARWQPLARADARPLEAHGLRPGAYLLLTAHRAGNVDPPDRLAGLVGLVRSLASSEPFGPVLFPIHPRTRERLHGAGLWDELAQQPGLKITDPLPYAELTTLLCQARAVLTDSGGIQKEAYLASVPCLTLRQNTEWVETVEVGWNTLVDLDVEATLSALGRQPPATHPPLYGQGDAAERCLEAIDLFAQQLETAAPRAAGRA